MAARVLVIDDEATFLEPLKALLEARGIEADYETTWEGGREAFRVAQHELVIADYNLPGSDHGLLLLSAIKVLNPATRLVLMSGQLGPEVRAQVEGVVDRFLEKVEGLDD